MLDDRQLENLIRMAAEIEAIDALASKQPTLRLTEQAEMPTERSVIRTLKTHRRFDRRWMAAIGSITMAAAAVALFFIPSGSVTNLPPLVNPPASSGVPADLYAGNGAAWPGALPWPFNGEPVAEEATAESVPASFNSGAEIRSALLAIIEDDSGRVECVKWTEHDSQSLAAAKASDLVAMSLMMACDRTPRQMTVVGLTGPVNELPLGDARAAEMATCIMHAPARCSSMTCCNPGAAIECIPDDVNVRLERVSFR